MNLGWLGCINLADELEDVLKNSGKSFSRYSKNHRKMARKVARRAEVNMALGRKPIVPFLRNLFVKGMLRSPLKTKVAEIFTMRGLENWWI
jgi:2-polyprenyl-6-methoxyphenol hydroxylase-like FAD-dependent oxidoreductase